MTSLTLTANPGTGSNRLTIVPTADVLRVRRTDANGTADVRTLTGQLPYPVGSGSGVLILDDYEPADGNVTYTVNTAAGNVSGLLKLELESPRLSTPEAPQFSAAVASVITYSAGGSTRSTVHEPDGPSDPIVITRGASTRRGTMMVEAGTFPAALNLARLCQRGRTMQLRQLQHAGMDMYFIPTTWDIVTRSAAGRDSTFDLSVQFIEVARPAGALSGALGWTWPSVAGEFPTWGAVTESYDNWGDLRTDVRKP